MIYFILILFISINSQINKPEHRNHFIKNTQRENYYAENRRLMSEVELYNFKKICLAEKQNKMIAMSFDEVPTGMDFETDLINSSKKQIKKEKKYLNLYAILSGISAAGYYYSCILSNDQVKNDQQNMNYIYLQKISQASLIINTIVATKYAMLSQIREFNLKKRLYISPFPDFKENFLKRFR